MALTPAVVDAAARDYSPVFEDPAPHVGALEEPVAALTEGRSRAAAATAWRRAPGPPFCQVTTLLKESVLGL